MLSSNILLMNRLASSQSIHRSYPPHRHTAKSGVAEVPRRLGWTGHTGKVLFLLTTAQLRAVRQIFLLRKVEKPDFTRVFPPIHIQRYGSKVSSVKQCFVRLRCSISCLRQSDYLRLI
jgi:hypothetical protein